MTIRFDDAWTAITTIALNISRRGRDVVALRDMVGRISIILNDHDAEVAPNDLNTWQEEMRAAAGTFCANNPILLATQLFQPDEIFEDPDLLEISEPGEGIGRCALLERRVVGGDWSRVRSQPASRRVTLYGFKGGVGRSSATFLLAQRLAEVGKSVLVIDLDLESPGIGPLLQSNSEAPEFGLVDYFVEAAVGNEADLDLVVRSNQFRIAGNGEVWVAPARGAPRDGYAYLPKLNRVYTELPSGGESGRMSFARRLESAVIACETEVGRRSRVPDVVLLDSRAGIHDVAAVAITQLSDLSLLFATDNPQTWTGYRDLFTQWSISGAAPLIRERLRMVASMVPPTATDSYLQKFRDRSQTCFAATLYDDAPAGDTEAYNPAPEDEEAPHFPIPILFVGELVGLDPSERSGWHESEIVRAAFGEFLDRAVELTVGADDA